MTTANDEAARVRGYLISQANKLSIPDLVSKVRADTLPLRDVAASVPAGRFDERPEPGEWSAAEVMTHVLDMTETGARAIEGIIESGALPPRVTDEIQAGSRAGLTTAADYWAVYEARREQLYERVLQAQGDEHLDIKITHQTFGAFSWREWLLFMRVHDLDHLRQIQAIVARM
jgi:hypothetical protein